MNLDGFEKALYFLIATLTLVVILVTIARYLFEKLISRLYKRFSITRTSVQLFSRGIVLILFNLIVLALTDMLKAELFSIINPGTGLILLGVGIVFAVLIALMSYSALKAGYGQGYGSLAVENRLDKGLMLATFALLAGPSEDIFFIGFVQNFFTQILSWGAIIAYLVWFLAYHYANVLSGIESKKEFLGTLPVRMVIACLLGVSFYITQTLFWGFIIHNLVDTSNFIVLLWAKSRKPLAEVSIDAK